MPSSLPSSTGDETEDSDSDGDFIGILGERVYPNNDPQFYEAPMEIAHAAPRHDDEDFPSLRRFNQRHQNPRIRRNRARASRARVRHGDLLGRLAMREIDRRERDRFTVARRRYESSDSEIDMLMDFVYDIPTTALSRRRYAEEAILRVLPDEFFRSGPMPDDYEPEGQLLLGEGLADTPEYDNFAQDEERSNTVPRQIIQPVEGEREPARFLDEPILDPEDEDDDIWDVQDFDQPAEMPNNLEIVQLPFPPPVAASSSEDEDEDEDEEENADGDDEAEEEQEEEPEDLVLMLENLDENPPEPQVDAIVGAHIAVIDQVRNMPRAPIPWRRPEYASTTGAVVLDTDEAHPHDDQVPETSDELPLDNRIHSFLSDLDREDQSAPGSDVEARQAEREAVEARSTRVASWVELFPGEDAAHLSPEHLAAHRDALQMIHRSASPRQEEEPAEAGPASPPHANTPMPNNQEIVQFPFPPPWAQAPQQQQEPTVVESFLVISFYLLIFYFFVIPYIPNFFPNSSSPPEAKMYGRKIRGFHISCWGYAQLIVLNVNFLFIFVFVYEIILAHLIQFYGLI